MTIKRMLGVGEDYDAFNQEILVFLNSSLFKLMQLGVGPSAGFSVTGVEETWDDLLGDRIDQLQAVKEFIYIDVRLAWDPPTQNSVITQWTKKQDELTWRILHQVEDSEARQVVET